MTLPVSGAISLSQIANEVGLSLPVSINHAFLLKLIGKTGLPVSFSDFYGKTGRFDGALAVSSNSPPAAGFPSSPFFGGTLQIIQGTPGTGYYLFFSVAPNWSGNIHVINTTTGVGQILPQISSIEWGNGSGFVGLLRPGVTDNFTILPSN
jgi:hypothetical protein